VGDKDVAAVLDGQQSAVFLRALLRDLAALELLLDRDALESGVRRVGAEQEMFLVDADMRPAPVSLEVIEIAADPRLTTELGLVTEVPKKGKAPAKAKARKASEPDPSSEEEESDDDEESDDNE